MKWKAFGQIGLALAKQMVPGVVMAENAVKALKSGGDKKEAVIAAALSATELTEFIKDNPNLVDNALLREGLEQVNDGYVKIAKALGKAA